MLNSSTVASYSTFKGSFLNESWQKNKKWYLSGVVVTFLLALLAVAAIAVYWEPLSGMNQEHGHHIMNKQVQEQEQQQQELAFNAKDDFKETADEVKKTAKEIKETAEEITGTIEDVRATVEDVAEKLDTIDEIELEGATDDEIVAGLKEAADTVEEVVDTIDEVYETVQDVAGKIEDITSE